MIYILLCEINNLKKLKTHSFYQEIPKRKELYLVLALNKNVIEYTYVHYYKYKTFFYLTLLVNLQSTKRTFFGRVFVYFFFL